MLVICIPSKGYLQFSIQSLKVFRFTESTNLFHASCMQSLSLWLSTTLENAPNGKSCTYGPLLEYLHEQHYTAMSLLTLLARVPVKTTHTPRTPFKFQAAMTSACLRRNVAFPCPRQRNRILLKYCTGCHRCGRRLQLLVSAEC
jgi:hypothetical protein